MNRHPLCHEVCHGVEETLGAMFLFKSAAGSFPIFDFHLSFSRCQNNLDAVIFLVAERLVELQSLIKRCAMGTMSVGSISQLAAAIHPVGNYLRGEEPARP